MLQPAPSLGAYKKIATFPDDDCGYYIILHYPINSMRFSSDHSSLEYPLYVYARMVLFPEPFGPAKTRIIGFLSDIFPSPARILDIGFFCSYIIFCYRFFTYLSLRYCCPDRFHSSCIHLRITIRNKFSPIRGSNHFYIMSFCLYLFHRIKPNIT